jgi:hypothetical protein
MPARPLPQISPLPLPVIMLQSSATQAPAPTPTPIPWSKRASEKAEGPNDAGACSSKSTLSSFDLPTLRLEVRDLKHSGSKIFLSNFVLSSGSSGLEFAVHKVLKLLYISPQHGSTTVPGTRSVTLILRNMDGVAYTTGSDLDNDHKEIHFSLNYINGIDKKRQAHEILGVLTHEMVHAYQYNGKGTCPGGLIEGIADWIRLKADLAPPHWVRTTTGKWDEGYAHTGYFLGYLETRFGDGTVSKLNEKLRTDRYEEKRFWTELLGRPVDQLWEDYGEALEAEEIYKRVAAEAAAEEEMAVVEKKDV